MTLRQIYSPSTLLLVAATAIFTASIAGYILGYGLASIWASICLAILFCPPALMLVDMIAQAICARRLRNQLRRDIGRFMGNPR